MTHRSETLQDSLLAAHATADLSALPELYRNVADQAEEAGDIPRACFFLTQAWVYALDAECPMADELRARLVLHGRDRK